MTNDTYKELVTLLRDYPEKERVLRYIKSKCKCIGCQFNNGRPNSACYNCD